MADDDDLVASAFDRGPHVVGARSGSKSLVGDRLDVERPRELAAGLARPEQRAREDDRRSGVLAAQPLPERPCLLGVLPGSAGAARRARRELLRHVGRGRGASNRENSGVARFRYVIADVFTDTPLQGNPVAVFTDAREIPEEKLQQIAREMNLSETVFVYKPEGDGHARIRIFTPSIEMPFAGHPTLGTAFILSGPLQLEEIRLETGMGLVPVRLERDDSGRIVFGRMAQPLPTIEPYGEEAELFDILGVGGSELPVEIYDNGVKHVYVALPLRGRGRRPAAAPGPAAEPSSTRFNCFAGEGARWKTRMFAPGERRGRGPGDRLGGRAARAAPRAPRADRLRRRDRDLAGRRGRSAVDPLRAGRGLGGRRSARRGRRLCRHRRPRRAQRSMTGPGPIKPSGPGPVKNDCLRGQVLRRMHVQNGRPS